MKLIFTLAALLLFLNIYAQNALNFDGSDDFVQTTYSGVTGSNNRTFEAWVYVSADAPASNLAILDYGLNAVGSRNTFMVNGSRGLSYISGGVDANIGTIADVVPEAAWTHVAFVLNDGTGYLYVNGVEYGTGPLTTVDTPEGGNDVSIGQRVPGGSILFEGSIDEVRLWDYARTIDEINTDMNAEFCTVPDGLVAYYKMNQGEAGGSNPDETIAFDLAGGGYDGELENFELEGDVSNWIEGADLDIGSVSSSFDAIGCDGAYTVPSGDMTYDTPGVYTDIIPSVMGCDSIMTITLTFAESTEGHIDTAICDGSFYISPSGEAVYTDSGVYEDIVPNDAGCDSVITINLTVKSVTLFSIEELVCDSYTSPTGMVYTESGEYEEVLMYVGGCDSVVYEMDIEIFESTEASISVTSCGDYTAPSGDVYSESAVFTDIIDNEAGCDSVISINLTVIPLDLDVTAAGLELTAEATDVSYQWIDCNTMFPIDGATEQAYTVTENGDYAVIITSGECSDTSECFSFENVGISEVVEQTIFNVFPNPARETITIQMINIGNTTVSIYDLLGKNLMETTLDNNTQLNVEFLPKGTYIINVSQGNQNEKQLFVKM